MELDLKIANQSTTTNIYGSFFVDTTEFAIPIDNLQEVVNFPDKITRMPLAPSFMLGVFNLRGIVIPIISLRELIKFPKAESYGSAKIAIVEFSNVRIGLLFDFTSEIIRANNEQKSEFLYSEDSLHKFVTGALKLENGSRIIQLIDPQALLTIENIPHVLENQKKLSAITAQHGQRKKCISFSVQGISMAFEISGIHEILRVPELKRSTFASAICMGMINIRGQVIPVINFAQLLGQPIQKSSVPDDQRIIVLKIEKEFFGLMVDAVDNISTYYPKDIMPIPLISKDRYEMFEGIIEFPDTSEVVLLNHHKVLSNSEVIQITRGHSKIYQENNQAESAKKNTKRYVYISFRLNYNFAVSIREIKEIIDNPKDITKAPGIPELVKGILNLRGNLVTVIDARLLYNLEAHESHNQKILIFQTGSEIFGLLVDSVESILTVNEDQKKHLPEILYSEASKGYKADVKEALEITDSKGEKISLMILDTLPIADRIRRAVA
jgi:purine-binding chemotaxis protein CheW